MNYPQNEIDWDLGDIVLHDADAKEPRMLMVVVGIQSDGTYLTVYLDQCDSRRADVYAAKRQPRSARTGLQHRCDLWINPKEALHDPALWLGDEWKEMSFKSLKASHLRQSHIVG